MAKKLDKKKTSKKSKLTEDEKEELVTEGELPKKSVRSRESKQLIWFFVIVGIIFASFLIPYFWVENTKAFEYGSVEYVIEEYAEPQGTIYHGRFEALTTTNLMYNIFLRNDPRTNDVVVDGSLDKFKRGGVLSTSPGFDLCRGVASAVMRDLGAFLIEGVGVGQLESGSTDLNVADESQRRFATCDTVLDKTLVVVDKGEARIVQDEENPYCYTIYIEDCNDAKPIEKFITQTIIDFSAARDLLEKNSVTS